MLATSERAIITTPHPDATRHGLDVLRRGGNAIEAALTAAAVLCVVYPHMTGLGGDACWLLAKDGGDPVGIMGIGQAAARLPVNPGGAMRGPGCAFTTAGAVDSWRLAEQLSRAAWNGRLDWSAILEPAIHYAKQGYVMSQSQAFWHQTHRNELSPQPGFSPMFEPLGAVPEAGHRQNQDQLGSTFEHLAKHGPRSFYEGPLALRIAAGLAAAGSTLTATDLNATHATYVTPLSLPYRTGQAINMPPPTQGISALQILNLLNKFTLPKSAGDNARFYILLIEAIKIALADRNTFVADPDFRDVPVNTLLGLEQACESRGCYRRTPNLPQAEGSALPGDTVWIGVRDAHGGSVSLIQSLFFDFGSGVVAGDTGVLWHNRAAAFSHTPGHPNAPEAGKRPLHTLCPALYRKDNKIHVIYGSQGGDGQPQTQTHVLTRIVDFGLDPLQALTRPRIHIGPTFLDSRKGIKAESDIGLAVIREFERQGYPIEIISALNAGTGQAGAITIDNTTGALMGAHDPRSEGLCLGL